MDKYKFGNRLYELRKANNITQEKLGKMLGVSNKAISKWENGESYPRLPMLDKIAECFNMSVEELLESKDNAKDEKEASKEINDSIPDEIMRLPKFTIRFLMGLGWVQVDAQDFLNTIITDCGISNREIANILDVSEKKIGLWENGIKKPSPRESLRITALYHNNCEDSEKINAYSDFAKRYKLPFRGLSFFLVYALVMMLFILYPLLVVGETAISVYFSSRIPVFSLKNLFSLALPIAIFVFISALILKSARLNRPNITKAIKNIAVFQAFYFAYLLIMASILKVEVGFIISIIVYYASTVAIEKLIKLNDYKNRKGFICLIPSYILVIAFLVYIFWFVEWDSPVPETYSLAIKEFSAMDIILAICMFSIISDLRIILTEINAFAVKLKALFPHSEKEYIPITKKDITLVIIGITLTIVYAVLVELFRRDFLELFFLIP